MQQREINLEQMEQTIRKVLEMGGEFSFLSGRNEYAAVYRPGAGQSHTCSTSGQDKKV